MGDSAVKDFYNSKDKRTFTKHLLNDIQALEYMLQHKMLESGVSRIGAEQELCLVDENYQPAMLNQEVLDAIKHPNFTTEIARFNMEINLDPLVFTTDCFGQLDRQLTSLLSKAQNAANTLNTHLLLTGICPTITRDHLYFEHMSPNPRYEALNEMITRQKGSGFEVNISGVDELIARHPNILFEACNTSFQVHLQIDPDEFTQAYNWAQLIAGPVLAVSANSPILMGKRLWSETRIALFQQSVDTRNPDKQHRTLDARVSFGNQWLRGTAVDHFKDNISRFNTLFASSEETNSMERVKRGEFPSLYALNMHNSTVYKWNRACYGKTNGLPHLRIENRYIPAGPTVIDEIANAAFWLGLMKGMPDNLKRLIEKMPFDDVRYNFYTAARMGLDGQFKWFGETLSAVSLLEVKLLPIAEEGLRKMKVHQADIRKYLGVINQRLKKRTNGSAWTNKNFSQLLVGSTANEAGIGITKKLIKWQNSGKAVHNWPHITRKNRHEYKEFKQVHQIMETDLVTVNEEDLAELAIQLMEWKKLNFIPVENDEHDFIGLITTQEALKYLSNKSNEDVSVKEIMLKTKEVKNVDPYCSTADAIVILADAEVPCLPVVANNKLVGLITENDIVKVAKATSRFRDKK